MVLLQKVLENSPGPCRAVLRGRGCVWGWQRALVPGSAPGAFVNNVHEMVVETLGPRVEPGIPRNNLAPTGARLPFSPCTSVWHPWHPPWDCVSVHTGRKNLCRT